MLANQCKLLMIRRKVLVSISFANWNPLMSWLRQLDGLRAVERPFNDLRPMQCSGRRVE